MVFKICYKYNVSGQYNVGYCYKYGIGTNKDEEKAFEWYLKSESRKP